MSRVYNKPDFISIGPTKTGSTWLHANLKKHPEIWLPPVKECRYYWYVRDEKAGQMSRLRDLKGHYFGNYYAKWRKTFLRKRLRQYLRNPGDITVSNLWWDLKYFSPFRSPAWYASLFSKKMISGDIDGTYAKYTAAEIATLRKYIPEVKILVNLRDPIDRLWSVIRMRFIYVQKLELDSLPVERIKMEIDRILEFYPLSNELLSRWRSVFRESEIHVSYFEDISNDPGGHFNSICEFLGISKVLDEEQNGELEKVVFKGPSHNIPPAVLRYLAETTISDTSDLYLYTGNPYVRLWLDRAREILDRD